MALSRASFPEAELSAAYIELLIRSLQKRGLDVHVLPLFQLLRMVARLAIGDEVILNSHSSSCLNVACCHSPDFYL